MQINAYSHEAFNATQTKVTKASDAAAWQQAQASAAIQPGGFPPILGVSVRADGSFHLEDLRAKLPSILRDFDREFRDALSAEGISAQPPFKLQVGMDGKVNVVPANDPRAHQIGIMMERNPGLSDSFRELTSAEGMLRAGDEASAFQRAYAKDPKAAVARFAWLLNPNDHRPLFQLEIGLSQSKGNWEDEYTGIS